MKNLLSPAVKFNGGDLRRLNYEKTVYGRGFVPDRAGRAHDTLRPQSRMRRGIRPLHSPPLLLRDSTAPRSPSELTNVTPLDIDDALLAGCAGLLLTATSLDGVSVNGTLMRFAQRHEHHDSKQPVLVIFSEQNMINVQQPDDGTGVSTVFLTN